MAKKAGEFSRYYLPVMTFGDTGLNYVPVSRYVSGSPWSKKWSKRAIADMYHFVRRTGQYKHKNYEREHELYGNGFYGSFKSLPQFVPLSWGALQMCYYGKGSPTQFGHALRIIDYYLTVADISLGYLGWNSKVSLQDYAYWYLGLDCNGFAGAYYQSEFPGTGISGNDHINFLHEKATLTERKSLADVRAGDMLVRRGSDGGNKRHVAVIDSVFAVSGKSAQVNITQSASSLGGLQTKLYALSDIAGAGESDSYGKLNWSLVGYHKFNRVLGPKA